MAQVGPVGLDWVEADPMVRQWSVLYLFFPSVEGDLQEHAIFKNMI